MRRTEITLGGWMMLVAGVGVMMFAGCGPRPTPGGTAGRLTSGGLPLSEVQLTIHGVEGSEFRALGIAVPSSDGEFRLVTMEARGPLLLTPGEYRCTLESLGAPVVIPPEYTSPATTPWKIEWSDSSQLLQLEAPPLRPLR